MAQITEYNPLEDEDFEYDVRICHKSQRYFFKWTWGNVIQGKLDF